MNDRENWDFERKPSKKERVIGIFSSVILVSGALILLVLSIYTIVKLGISKTGIGLTIFSLLFLALASWFLYRFSFTEAKPLGFTASKITAYVIMLLGMGSLVGSVWAKDNPASMFSIGLILVSGGFIALRKRRNSGATK